MNFARVLVLITAFYVSLASAEHEGTSTPLAPASRRPLSSEKSWLRGTDVTIHRSSGGGYCQAAPVAKRGIDTLGGICRIAFLIAAHCVDDLDISSIEFSGIGNIPKIQMEILISEEYDKKNKNGIGDSATIVFNVPCEKVEKVIPVPLAPVDSQGVTVINSPHVYLQKRLEAIDGNRGGSVQILADVTNKGKNYFEFYVPTPQGYSTVAGDSGGPIFNEKGQLVGAIATSSYEYLRKKGWLTRPPDGSDKVLDPFYVQCDKRAIGKLRENLARFGLSPSDF